MINHLCAKSVDSIGVEVVKSLGDIPALEIKGKAITFREFNSSRNLLVTALERHGVVGPVKQVLVTSKNKYVPDDVGVEAHPDFYVVNDQLYESIRLHTIELNGLTHISVEMLDSVWKTLVSYPEWQVRICHPDVYFIIDISKIYVFVERGGLVASDLTKIVDFLSD